MLSVPCPTCNRPVQWSDQSPWRPFCSERCKVVDLGAWASEQRKIAGEPVVEDGSEEEDSANN
jgi:uncharacterized protein